jgi:hypothetical protein
MKRYALTLAVLLLVANTYGGSVVHFKISKPFCVLNFLRAAGNDAHVSRTLIAYVRRHVPTADSARFYKAVNSFMQIELDNSFTWTEYPTLRQKPKSLAAIINNAAIQCNSIEEFLNRTTGLLPNEQWQQLRNAMQTAAPVYEKMMSGYAAAMNNQLAALETYAEEADNIFYQLKKFYGSSWGDDIPFTVGLFGIPGAKGNTNAAPYSNSLALGVLTEETNHKERMGVAIHEICHVLYEEQPLKLQRRLDSVFAANKSAYARYAYGYLDEALATACGNGWAYAQLAGSLDTAAWYDDDYINRFAKALYSEVKRYIKAGKTLDKAFVNKAVLTFERTFPDAIYDYANLLNSVNLYTDAPTHDVFNDLYNSLSRHVRMTNSNASYPIADKETQDRIDNEEGTQLFIVHSNHAENFGVLKKKFPQIADLDAGKEGIASFYDNRKRPVIVINVRSTERVEEAAQKMMTIGKMNPNQLFYPL